MITAGVYTLILGGVGAVDKPITYQIYSMETATSTGNIIDKSSSNGKLYYNFTPNQMSMSVSDFNFFINHEYARTVL